MTHLTHLNRLLVIFSLLTAIIPLSTAAMLLNEAHVLGATILWAMY